MGNYEQLKAAIKDVIKTNGTQSITGQVLQNSLLAIISRLGDNATFAGVATPATNPRNPDANVFWLAAATGTYSNFAGLKVEDEAAVFYNNNGTWRKFDTGIPSQGKIENMETKITEVNNRVGNTDYVVCSVGSIIADKAITIPDYELNTKTRILVKMDSENTANNATLRIDRASDTIPAKPLFYNGVRASADNSWEAGAVLDIYFDGTNFQATQWAGGGAGGNKILEWNTDVATTRKEVKTLERKSGMMISYKDPDSGWINEQYIGTLFTDTEWVKDSNWERILNFDVVPNEDYPTLLSNGEFFDGYGFISLSTSTHRLTANISLGVIAYPLEADTTYTIDNMTFETVYLKSMAFAIKDGSSGTGVDFRLLLPTEISCKAPNLGLGGLIASTSTGEIVTNKEKYIINPLVVTSELIGQLYLIIGYRFNALYNQVKVYNREISDALFKNIFIPKNGTLENYEYIKEKACELGTETTKNIFSKDNISLGYGVIYNTQGRLGLYQEYQCTFIPLEFDTYYTVSGYKWISLGGISGADNVCLACEKDEVIVNLKASDFKAENTWLNTDTFFTKTDNIYKEKIGGTEVFTFKTPKATELNVDNIGIVINTLFANLPIEFVDGLQVEVGTSPTDYVEGGGNVLEKVFGYPLPKTSSGGGGTSGDAVLNYLKNQVMFFFGDSITEGTDGGYVGLVKEKVGLGNVVNYGSSGAATGRLVDIMTGLGIREPVNVRNVDYMTCKAITIQIGTNGGISGNFEKDIPNISIYDIQSYPYTYNNPDGTITDATLDNAEDYFKKLFPNTFYGNLALCLEWVRWKNPNCRVYLITIPPSDRNNHIAVRDALIELGNLYSIHVIDAQANSGCSIRNITEWSLDKTHLNVVGNELWASYIARELVTNYYDTEIES